MMKIAPEFFFYVVAYRMASSHKCNIITSANCAEADLAFLMAYDHIWAESESVVANSTSVLFYVSLIVPEPVH